MTEMTAVRPCLICDMEKADETSTVFRDDLWACEIVPGYDVPGWFVLRARRHAETITGLDDAEIDSLGLRARNVVAAVSEVTGAPATYFLVFGESYPHFHALIAARGEHVPEARRTGDILKLAKDHADPTAAARLVPAVRDAYERMASVGLTASLAGSGLRAGEVHVEQIA